MLTAWLTTEEVYTPYIAAAPTDNSTQFTTIALLVFLAGGGILLGGIATQHLPLGIVGFAFMGLSGMIFLAFAEGEEFNWSEQTASELSDHYGVNVTKDMLLRGNVEERVSKRLPSYIPLFKEASLKRDDEDGSFTIPAPSQELYLLIDGKVLEVMTREGNTFRPYVAEASTSEQGSDAVENNPAMPAQ